MVWLLDEDQYSTVVSARLSRQIPRTVIVCFTLLRLFTLNLIWGPIVGLRWNAPHTALAHANARADAYRNWPPVQANGLCRSHSVTTFKFTTRDSPLNLVICQERVWERCFVACGDGMHVNVLMRVRTMRRKHCSEYHNLVLIRPSMLHKSQVSDWKFVEASSSECAECTKREPPALYINSPTKRGEQEPRNGPGDDLIGRNRGLGNTNRCRVISGTPSSRSLCMSACQASTDRGVSICIFTIHMIWFANHRCRIIMTVCRTKEG